MEGEAEEVTSWLDHIEDRVNELLTALERIAAALERIADQGEKR